MVMPNVALRLLASVALVAGLALAGGAIAAPSDATVASDVKAVEANAGPKDEPACGRKVKVVYAGYGEAERAGCAVSAKASD